MKVNLQQLTQQLSSQLAGIYLVSGDEPILKQEAMQAIRKAAKQQGFTDRVRLQAEAGMNEDQLYTALYSPSLTAEKTLLELDCRSKAPTKGIASLLAEYAAKPASSLLLIIDTAKLEDAQARSAWYKAVEKAGVIVTLWPITREQLPQWLMARAQKYKLTLKQDAAALLTDYVEGNLTAAAQTLEKIFLLKHDKPIDAEVIQTLLTDESRFTIFDLTDALISGDAARILHILDTLNLDGTEPAIVLWGITRELRLMAEMASELKSGISFDELCKKHRIFFRRTQNVRRFLSQVSRAKCLETLNHAAAVDAILKGAAPGNSWEALQMLCLRLV